MPTMEDQKITTADDLAKLQVGDAVIVTRDGRTSGMHVVRIAEPGSMGRSVLDGPRVTIGYGPGRYNFEVDGATLRAGHVTIEKG